jgi:ubiquinone/menaquinone biosynthesis C-methylase UbiE
MNDGAGTHSDRDYYVLHPDSIQVRIATKQRQKMYRRFVELFGAGPDTTILDVGVTSDRTFANSNYLEAWHPHSNRITALGLADASFLRDQYPGLTFVRGDGLNQPFPNQSFDIVHCAAVIEHVGTFERQSQLVTECARVARCGFMITTPYRWFPIEVHTSLPLLHWLPKAPHRAVLRRLGYLYYSDEANLNLMGKHDFRRIAAALPDYTCEIEGVRLSGFMSNLLFVGRRRS